ncbi:MAG: hypothetical protein ACXWUN_09520 [Allosphingosinicella sp.]
MADKKTTGVKSVTLADVRAAEASSAVKAPTPSPGDDDYLKAKDADNTAKELDKAQPGKTSKDLDTQAKRLDKTAKKQGG